MPQRTKITSSLFIKKKKKEKKEISRTGFFARTETQSENLSFLSIPISRFHSDIGYTKICQKVAYSKFILEPIIIKMNPKIG